MSGKIERVYMNGSLAKVNNDLQNSSSHVVAHTSNYVQGVVDRLIDKQMNLFQRFFPDERRMAVIKGELQLVKTEFEYRQKAFEIVRKTQIESLEEICNQYLQQGRVATRSDTALFLMKKSAELQEELERLSDNFMESMDRRIEKIQQLNSLNLRQKRMEQIDNDIDTFMDLQTHILKQFQQVVMASM